MGSSSSKQQNEKPQNLQKKNPLKSFQKLQTSVQPDNWIYEAVLQFLVSPIWKNPIYQFYDDYCALFDDEEESQVGHLALHKEFIILIEGLVDDFMKDIQIDEETLKKQVERGLKSKNYHKYFEQLLVVDDFIVFKKILIRRNLQFEYEALQQLADQDDQINENQQQTLQQAMLAKEQAEIEHALSVSLVIEQQKKDLEIQEDEELLEAIQQSEIIQQFETQEKGKEQEILVQQLQAEKQLENKQKQISQQQQIQEAKIIEENRQKQIIEQRKQEDAAREQSESQKLLEIQKIQKYQQKKLIAIQQVEVKEQQVVAPTKAELQRQALQQKLEEIKKQVQDENQQKITVNQEESPDDRKERLKQQRELIRKKKQAERDVEMKKFEESGSKVDLNQKQNQPFIVDKNELEENKKQEELQRKKNTMNKIKSDLSRQ